METQTKIMSLLLSLPHLYSTILELGIYQSRRVWSIYTYQDLNASVYNLGNLEKSGIRLKVSMTFCHRSKFFSLYLLYLTKISV